MLVYIIYDPMGWDRIPWYNIILQARSRARVYIYIYDRMVFIKVSTLEQGVLNKYHCFHTHALQGCMHAGH